jgi:hypothetical protein
MFEETNSINNLCSKVNPTTNKAMVCAVSGKRNGHVISVEQLKSLDRRLSRVENSKVTLIMWSNYNH